MGITTARAGMNGSREVLADAAFWIARRNQRDENHEAAIAITQRLLRERVRLVVTPLIFAEAHAYFSRAAILRERFIADCWKNPIVRMEQPSYEDQQNAIDILLAHKDKTFSFCDAVSFAIMRRLRVSTAVTFDDHFRQFGAFEVIDQNYF
jgi:predicted nucleic acid-binding protein